MKKVFSVKHIGKRYWCLKCQHTHYKHGLRFSKHREFALMQQEFCCYHITTKDRLPNILKYGLKPNSVPNWFSSKTPYIMLSLYPYWSLYKHRKEWGLPIIHDNALILIEIKCPSIKREYFDDPEGLRWAYTIKPKYFNAIVEFNTLKHGNASYA